MPLKIFVAGGTGVLGRVAVPALLAEGHSVRSTARGKQKANFIRGLGAEPIECDLYDFESIRKAVAGCDVVIRLTTKIGSMSSIRDAKSWDETNRLRTEGARLLVDAALAEEVSTYIHESVTFVYADGGTRWLNEDSPTDDGESGILRATLHGEGEAARFTDFGRKGIVLRFGGFYGGGAPSTAEMLAMAKRRLLCRIGDAANYFSSIYVPDAGAAVAAAVNAPAGIYNVTDDNPIPFAEYLAAVASAAGAKDPLRMPGFLGKLLFGKVWNYFSRSQRVSNAELKRVSGWRPQVKSALEGWPLVARSLPANVNVRTERAA